LLSRLASYTESIDSEAAVLRERLAPFAETGEPFDVCKPLSGFTLEVVGQAAFGYAPFEINHMQLYLIYKDERTVNNAEGAAVVRGFA